MKKLISLVLILSLILVAFAGCGSSATTTDDTAASSAASIESAEAVASEAEAQADEEPQVAEDIVEEASAEVEISAEEPVEEAVEEPEKVYAVIDYPLAPETLTMWSEIKASVAVDEWNDLVIMDSIAEKSGITLDITSVSDSTATEQFNLMVASGTAYDLLMAPDIFYAGGLVQAYNDDVILDLTDMVEEHAPDYLRYVDGLNEKSRATVINDDKYLCVYSIADAYYNIVGCVIRQDWLDDQGLERPTDLDSFTEALYSFYNNYAPEYTLFTTDASLTYLSDLFNTYTVGYSQTSLPVYVMDGEVKCPFTTDEYRAYLEWFAEMYGAGIVNKDFYTTHPLTIRSACGNNGTGFWSTRCEGIDEWQLYCEDPAILEYCDPQPMEYMNNGDGTFDFGSEMTYVDEQACYSISAQCSNPELALEYLNWFFTDEGSTIVNYGVEGYTWEAGADGTPVWTELVTNNSEGYSIQTVVNATTGTALFACLQQADRMFSTYSETAQLFLEYCNTNITDQNTLPTAAGLTTEQSNEVSDDITSLLTYTSEQLLKFMTCAEEINDDTWATFQQTISDMGIDHMLELYQEDYDAYSARFA